MIAQGWPLAAVIRFAEAEPPPPLPLGLMLALGGAGVLSAALVVVGSVLLRRKRLRELARRDGDPGENPRT
ncbi:hypothetical protein [Leucobacter sp. M11]|uniref:hypothetical protein n=1 Tax=Leucobacter sp. M11 TaxID=2993565 RepID=UPI002D7EC4A5|nr:hypothetical protein [Leucobacter sp. M11]MEB4614510.1 hypothetical protein [Leucobacter sp. M11]